MARVTFRIPPEAPNEPRREASRGPLANRAARDGGLLQMLVLQVNLVVLVLFGAYLAGYLGPSMVFPQGAAACRPAREERRGPRVARRTTGYSRDTRTRIS